MNKLAAQLGSTVRAVAYDRPGFHNGCLILFHQLTDLEARGISVSMLPMAIDADVVDPDNAMEAAIRQARLIDLDSFVHVEVRITDDFADFVTQLCPMNEREPLIIMVGGEEQHCYPEGRAKLIHAVRAFDGALLPIGSEYRVAWTDPCARLATLALENGTPVAMASATALIVTEIPAEVRAASENCEPIPPFHLRDMDDDMLDEYGSFLSYDQALQALKRAVAERVEAVQLINGYGNTVTSLDPDGGD